MPKAYYQCPVCKGAFASRYNKGRFLDPGPPDDPPEVYCDNHGSAPKALMTYRGDGWSGIDNWPHGEPDWAKRKREYRERMGIHG